MNVERPTEIRLVTSHSIVLDPAYSPAGAILYHSYRIGGVVELWSLNLATKAITRIKTTLGLIELEPLSTSDGSALVYHAKTRSGSD